MTLASQPKRQRRPNRAPHTEAAALTATGERLHCAATAPGELSEMDRRTVEHFQETLAEVALAVASREKESA